MDKEALDVFNFLISLEQNVTIVASADMVTLANIFKVKPELADTSNEATEGKTNLYTRLHWYRHP